MKKKIPILIIALLVIPLAIGVFIRETGTYQFKRNAGSYAKPSMAQACVIGWEQLAAVKTKTLIIDLSSNGLLLNRQFSGNVHIPASRLLEKASLDTLKAHRKETRVLYSPDPGEAAKAWMLLSQMGYRNLYILADDPDNEKMKYPFRPEPTVQTETE